MILQDNDKSGPAAAGAAGKAGSRARRAGEALTAVLDRTTEQLRLAVFGCHLLPLEDTVHHLRVMERQLRVVLAAGGGILPAKPVAALGAELKWLHAGLGPVRELDVLTANTIVPLREAFPRDVALAALQELTRKERAKAAEAMAKAIDSRRAQRLLLQLEGWQKSGWGPQRAGPAARSVERLAGEAIDVAYRRARKALAKAAGRNVPALHAARKDVKKLTYALQLFGGAFGKDVATPMRRAARRLQNVLGDIQDGDTSSRLVRRLTRGRNSKIARASMLALGYEARRVSDALGRFPRAYKAFRRAEKFW